MKENISSEFNINKTRGNEFFYEQTKVDEDLFLSTVVVGQQELKLEKQQQSILVQKIANLIGTGEDNVSFKRAIDRVNRRQLDEVGTSKSREKPINIISRKIEKLELEKKALTKYEDFRYDIEENRNDLKNEILKLENKNSFLKEIKQIFEKEKIEKEKIKLQENIKNENYEKINSIKLKIDKIKNNNKETLENDSDTSKKDKKISRQRNKLNKKMIFMFIFIIIFNILQFIFIDNKLFNYVILASIPMTVVYFIYQKYKINPISGCLLSFIQLPLLFAFLEAINRTPSIFENNFLVFQMGTTPIIGISQGNYWYILLLALILLTSYFSFRKTLQDQSAQAKQMKFTIYFMLGIIFIASFTLPTALGLYWITSSLFTIAQNIWVERRKDK